MKKMHMSVSLKEHSKCGTNYYTNDFLNFPMLKSSNVFMKHPCRHFINLNLCATPT